MQAVGLNNQNGLIGAQLQRQPPQVLGDTELAMEVEKRAPIPRGVKANKGIGVPFGPRTEAVHKPSDGRRLEQDRMLHWMADHALDLEDHLCRQERVAASFE